MPKLHELLAVDGNLKQQADKTRLELMGTFEKKTHLFSEKIVSYKSYGENEPAVVESQLDLQTTVPKELKWISEFLTKSLDVSYQVAEANTIARADVILAAIPTLDPAKGFRLDPDKGTEIFKAREDHRIRTKKINKVLTLAPPTDKHPAQVQVVIEDVPVGDITTLEWSGLITTAAKGDMLSRVEMLTRAVKKARARANEVEISKNDIKIGGPIISFVFGL